MSNQPYPNDRQLKANYMLQRKMGNSPHHALLNAQTQLEWNRLSPHVVRLDWVHDEDPDTSWLGEYSNSPDKGAVDRRKAGDWNREEYRYFNPTNPKCASLDYKIMNRIQRDGMWVLRGEYRLGGKWIVADSVGGMDERGEGNGYEYDIMRETIKQYAQSVEDDEAGNCPHCHGTGKKNG